RPSAALVHARNADLGSEDRAVVAYDPLRETQARAAEPQYRGHDLERVVQPCRSEELRLDRTNDEGDGVVLEERLLAVAERAQPFGAGSLAIAQVIGIVDDACCV